MSDKMCMHISVFAQKVAIYRFRMTLSTYTTEVSDSEV